MPHPPIIVPGVSNEPPEAKKTIKAMEELARKMAGLKPDTLVLISPHAPLFQDYLYLYDQDRLTGSMAAFGADQIQLEFKLDRPFLDRFSQLAEAQGVAAGGLSKSQLRRFSLNAELDHGAFVPLYFLSRHCDFELLVMSSPDMSLGRLYQTGRLIRQVATELDRKTVIIASGDQSHKANARSPYGSNPAGAEYDRLLVEALENNDLASFMLLDAGLREEAAECGFRSIVMLGGALHGLGFKSSLLSYEAPYGIGYCVAELNPVPEGGQLLLDPFAQKAARQKEQESAPVQIARRTIEHWLARQEVPAADYFADLGQAEPWLWEKSGVFVSLYEDGRLRGCIGTIAAMTDSIMAEISQNAISAATSDPRFLPVTEQELAGLTISVDVLGKPEPVFSEDELDPEQFGVIVRAGGRTGLLLPDLAGVTTVENQLAIAKEKAGISATEPYDLEKFGVRRYR